MKTAFKLLRCISCIFFIQFQPFYLFSQSGEITKKFVDYDEKPTNSKYSPYYIETYKTNNTEVYWQRKLYYADTTEGTVASIGTCKDLQGEIKDGAYVYYYKNGTKKKYATQPYLMKLVVGKGLLFTMMVQKMVKVIMHQVIKAVYGNTITMTRKI